MKEIFCPIVIGVHTTCSVMHLVGSIVNCTCLDSSTATAYLFDDDMYNKVTFIHNMETSIQGCIKMEATSYATHEDELFIQKSMFFGTVSESNEERLKQNVTDVTETQMNEKNELNEDWSIRMIANKLRHFADNFEMEFENSSATVLSPESNGVRCFRTDSSDDHTKLNCTDSSMAFTTVYNHIRVERIYRHRYF
ncbi:unnamed protein product [Thelazia callipaeda]|uniref:Phlebovirus glycoprotein G2 fusion domain-containing protein n=1 Tax=Thelazia callipaeda TaxID=103827 RepID=A0A0N5CRU0_THECL|nr:unnamed protein product [Thelazia callipaeda]